MVESTGMSTKRSLDLWESGSRALNQADYIGLGGQHTNALQKGIALENGFQTTTTGLESFGKSLQLIPTGLTPYGDFAAGIGIGATSLSTALDSPIK